MKRLGLLIVIAGIVLVAMSAFQYLMRPGSGDAAPAFVLKNIDGTELTSESLEGKPLLVHFWATWCTYCREEFPSLNRLAKAKKKDGLVVIAISEDGLDNEEAVQIFLKSMKTDFPIFMDDEGKVADAFGSYGLPDSILVSRDGMIAKRLEGAVNWDSRQALDSIDVLIKGKGSKDEGDKGAKR